MTVTRLPGIAASLRPSDHPYLSGAWTPLHEEVDATTLDIIAGAIPPDLDGIYLRNTENPVHEALGRYHPFDGDGMIHGISFAQGTARYANRFVRTKGFLAEQAEGGSLWGGLMDPPGTSRRPGWGAHGALKDASSTDVVIHAGRALSTFYQCGEGYRLDPQTLETLGTDAWVPADGISAHAKVDERTGELLFFNYAKLAPYMHYGVVDRHNRLVHYTPIPLPGPRLPHDMAFTENYSILNDMPLFWDPALLARGLHVARYHRDLPSRFAIIPRYGTAEQIRWFEAAPTYVLHWLNAYEDGDEIVLDGYFQDDPAPPPLATAPPGLGHMMAYVDEHSFKPRLHRWRFDLVTGRTREIRMDERVLEFGTINQRYAGRRHRYAYSTTAKPGWFLFDGFVKHDLDSGRSWTLRLPEGCYASEAPFAPRLGARDEDDGYLVSFVTDETQGGSECLLIDAKRFAEGPICRIRLPHKISSGTHACWASREFLEQGVAGC